MYAEIVSISANGLLWLHVQLHRDIGNYAIQSTIQLAISSIKASPPERHDSIVLQIKQVALPKLLDRNMTPPSIQQFPLFTPIEFQLAGITGKSGLNNILNASSSGREFVLLDDRSFSVYHFLSRTYDIS